jgi:hypothetical protein
LQNPPVPSLAPPRHAPSRPMLSIHITHSASNTQSDRRFDGSMTVGQLKDKLHAIVGTSPEHMRLQLMSDQGQVKWELTPDEATLHSLLVPDNSTVHVVDTDPLQSVAALHDVSRVEKYQISEDAYSKRKDTFREFKKNFLKDKVSWHWRWRCRCRAHAAPAPHLRGGNGRSGECECLTVSLCVVFGPASSSEKGLPPTHARAPRSPRSRRRWRRSSSRRARKRSWRSPSRSATAASSSALSAER